MEFSVNTLEMVVMSVHVQYGCNCSPDILDLELLGGRSHAKGRPTCCLSGTACDLKNSPTNETRKTITTHVLPPIPGNLTYA